MLSCVRVLGSNMFQHGVRIFLDDYLPIESLDTPEEDAQREYMEDFYYWMRTVWQHIVSHYVSDNEHHITWCMSVIYVTWEWVVVWLLCF